jgi:hypothetical protein
MIRTSHRKLEATAKSGKIPALFGALLLCLLVLPAQALVVTVDLGWGYNSMTDTDLNTYNLQEGSIVQVIMYNSATASAPGANANQNFGIYANYTGTGIAAEPYPGTEPSNVPGDTTIYFPNSAPADHVIAYTTQIGGPLVDSNANGANWYNIYAQFEILGTYDRLYIRVFGATDFSQGEVISSYWGLSAVQNGTNVIDTWYVDIIDDTVANKTNYFEVIPEPGSLALFALGATGLLAGYRRRQKTVRGK